MVYTCIRITNYCLESDLSLAGITIYLGAPRWWPPTHFVYQNKTALHGLRLEAPPDPVIFGHINYRVHVKHEIIKSENHEQTLRPLTVVHMYEKDGPLEPLAAQEGIRASAP